MYNEFNINEFVFYRQIHNNRVNLYSVILNRFDFIKTKKKIISLLPGNWFSNIFHTMFGMTMMMMMKLIVMMMVMKMGHFFCSYFILLNIEEGNQKITLINGFFFGLKSVAFFCFLFDYKWLLFTLIDSCCLYHFENYTYNSTTKVFSILLMLFMHDKFDSNEI